MRKRILGVDNNPMVLLPPSEAETPDKETKKKRKRSGFDSLVRTSLGGIVQDEQVPFVRKRLLGE
ncbi:MAG: hypothetical protein GDA54_01640 [Alphaproteobacteria bacterium GM7ARS4]|nr:hypothetical protein [Alphaproteobacteria bacterium GM7ARS4]